MELFNRFAHSAGPGMISTIFCIFVTSWRLQNDLLGAPKWPPGGFKITLEHPKSMFVVIFVAKWHQEGPKIEKVNVCQPILTILSSFWGPFWGSFSIKNRLKNQAFFWCHFRPSFSWFFNDFWLIFGACERSKITSKAISKRLSRFCKNHEKRCKVSSKWGFAQKTVNKLSWEVARGLEKQEQRRTSKNSEF